MVNNMTFVPTAQAPTPSRAQLIPAATLPPQAASEPASPPPTIQEAAAATANAANQVLEASTLVQQWLVASCMITSAMSSICIQSMHATQHATAASTLHAN